MSMEMRECADTKSAQKPGLLRRVWSMYYDGFRGMTIGRYLWLIIILKVAVLFLVFRLIFFPNILQSNYDTDEERAEAVRTNLTK